MIKLLPRPLSVMALAGALLATCTATATAAYPAPVNGKIAYAKSISLDGIRLHVIDPDGTDPTPLTDHGGQDLEPSFSPDGTKIAYASRPSTSDDFELRVHDLVTGADVPITDTAQSEREPTWSPDGSKLAYSRDGSIWVMNVDGSDQHAVTSHTSDRQPAWNPANANVIAFVSEREAIEFGERDLWQVNLIDNDVSPLSRNADDEANPS